MSAKASPKTGSPKTAGAAGLGVVGSKPPTRSGSAIKTGMSTSGMSPMDALRHTLVKKMREKFGEAAKDVKSQEIIASEVNAFMANGGGMQSEDLDTLENRVRSRLAGDTPVQNTRTMQKRSEIQRDEWAKMYKFQHEIGTLQDQKEAMARFNAEKAVMQCRKEQNEMRHQLEQQEKDEEYLYHLEQMEALKKWEEEEQEKLRQKNELINKLKEDRSAQIKSRDRRRNMHKQQLEEEDQNMLRHLADLTRKDLEREEAQRQKNLARTEKFKAENENTKRIREEEKRKLALEDLEYQRKYREQLDKQERDRAMLVAKVTEIQNRQQTRAQTLPPYKQFVPEEKIEAEFKAHEKYLDEKERLAKETIKKNNWEFKLALDKQVHEKILKREDEKRQELAYGTIHIADAEQARKEDMERKLALLNRSKAYKQQLQSQMKEDAIRKKEALMTEVEKKINRNLLEKVEEYKKVNAIS